MKFHFAPFISSEPALCYGISIHCFLYKRNLSASTLLYLKNMPWRFATNFIVGHWFKLKDQICNIVRKFEKPQLAVREGCTLSFEGFLQPSDVRSAFKPMPAQTFLVYGQENTSCQYCSSPVSGAAISILNRLWVFGDILVRIHNRLRHLVKIANLEINRWRSIAVQNFTIQEVPRP